MFKNYIDFEKNIYTKIAKARCILLRPLVKFLSLIKITPDQLSYTGVFLMIVFAIILPFDINLSLGILIGAILLDNLDGPLARHQKIATDKGKFKDILCDNIVFTLFIVGLINAGYIAGLNGAVFIYIMAISKALRCVFYALRVKSDWYFKIFAGTSPNIFVVLSYFFFIILVIVKANYLNQISVIASLALAIDSVYFYSKIIKTEKT